MKDEYILFSFFWTQVKSQTIKNCLNIGQFSKSESSKRVENEDDDETNARHYSRGIRLDSVTNVMASAVYALLEELIEIVLPGEHLGIRDEEKEEKLSNFLFKIYPVY